MDFAQVVLSAMMPYFYALLLVSGVVGVKFGIILRGYKFFAITVSAIFLLSKLTPLLFSGLFEILLRGCIYSAVIGIIFAYVLKQLTVLFFRFV